MNRPRIDLFQRHSKFFTNIHKIKKYFHESSSPVSDLIISLIYVLLMLFKEICKSLSFCSSCIGIYHLLVEFSRKTCYRINKGLYVLFTACSNIILCKSKHHRVALNLSYRFGTIVWGTGFLIQVKWIQAFF